MAARFKAWVCACSLGVTEGSNPAGGMSVVGDVCCKVDVSATGRSLTRRSPKEGGVSQSDSGTSTTRRPWPSRAAEPWKKKVTSAVFKRNREQRLDGQTLA